MSSGDRLPRLHPQFRGSSPRPAPGPGSASGATAFRPMRHSRSRASVQRFGNLTFSRSVHPHPLPSSGVTNGYMKYMRGMGGLIPGPRREKVGVPGHRKRVSAAPCQIGAAQHAVRKMRGRPRRPQLRAPNPSMSGWDSRNASMGAGADFRVFSAYQMLRWARRGQTADRAPRTGDFDHTNIPLTPPAGLMTFEVLGGVAQLVRAAES